MNQTAANRTSDIIARLDHESAELPKGLSSYPLPGSINNPHPPATLGDGTIADEGLVVRPAATRTFDRYLRFRHLSQPLTPNGTFRVRDQGIIATYFEEEHQETFSKAFFALEGDLLEIEYPASYGYFLFGKDSAGEWKYTTKSV